MAVLHLQNFLMAVLHLQNFLMAVLHLQNFLMAVQNLLLSVLCLQNFQFVLRFLVQENFHFQQLRMQLLMPRLVEHQFLLAFHPKLHKQIFVTR